MLLVTDGREGREGKGVEKGDDGQREGDVEERGSILGGQMRDNLWKKKDGEEKESKGDRTMLKGSGMEKRDRKRRVRY